MNFVLLVLVVLAGVFLMNIFFQLVRIETALKHQLEDIETFLLNQYGRPEDK